MPSNTVPSNIDTNEQITDRQLEYDENNYEDVDEQETPIVSVHSPAVWFGSIEEEKEEKSQNLMNKNENSFCFI